MGGIRRDDRVITVYRSVMTLPAGARAVMEQTNGLFTSLSWWILVQAHGLPPGAQASFVTVHSAEETLAVIPILQSRGACSGLTTPYSCSFVPMMAAGLNQSSRKSAMAAFARFCRVRGVVRLDALPEEWDGLAALQTGALRAGLVPLRFDHFGNWYEDVSGLDWVAYLRRRPGALRETIRRRLRRAESLADARFRLFTGLDEMRDAAEAFESVYRRSWKEAEPYPAFNVALIEALALSGRLRLGVWSIGATHVAVQLWAVEASHAIVLKLAHDEAFKAHSPGTVLTALMLRHLLDTERVTQIDFGRGDDSYKQGWAVQRRQRIGMLLAAPWHPAGLFALLRHGLGRMRAAYGRAFKSTKLVRLALRGPGVAITSIESDTGVAPTPKVSRLRRASFGWLSRISCISN